MRPQHGSRPYAITEIFFEGSAFMLDAVGIEDHRCFLFLYATQNPLEAMFLPLSCVTVILLDSFDEIMPRGTQGFLHNFTFALGEYCCDADLPFASDGDDVLILEDVFFVGKRHFASDQRLVLWHVYTSGLPLAAARSKGSNTKSRAGITPSNDLLERFPWLRAYFRDDRS